MSRETHHSDHPARIVLQLPESREVYSYPLRTWPASTEQIQNASGLLKQQHVKGNEPYEIYLIIQSKANGT